MGARHDGDDQGVTQCSEAQVAAEACPEALRIATVKVKAGPGAAPYELSGAAYLTGGWQIKEGIVLRLRDLTLDVDRKDLLRNPTSCGPKLIRSSLTGSAGATAGLDTAVQLSGCEALPFRPKIDLRFGNNTQRRKGGHPRLTANVTQCESEAGIKSTQVALPKQVALEAENAQALCEKADAAKAPARRARSSARPRRRRRS